MSNTPHGTCGTRQLGTSVLLCAALAGCASPYVQRPPLDYARMYPATSLSAAVAHAHNVRDSYRAKIIELGESERALSNGLVTLGAALIAAGVYGAHRDTLVGGALFGGTAYSLGVMNTDKRRPVIYVVGMKALDCAVDAVAPLNFDTQTADDLRRNADSLDKLTANVAATVGDVQRLIAKVEAATGETAETKAARQDLLSAQQSLAKADVARGAVEQLLVKRSTAGGLLTSAVSRIDTAVLDEIRGTEGALQAVPDVLTGLVGASQIFVPNLKLADIVAPPTAAKGDEKANLAMGGVPRRAMTATPDDTAALAAAAARLRGETAMLDGRSERLNAFVREVDPAKAVERLKGCKVDSVVTAMTVDPSELTFKAKSAEKKTITMKGGKAPYAISFAAGLPTGFSLERPLIGESVFVVAATDQTVAGTHTLIVTDGARQQQLIMVKVQDATTQTTTSTNTPEDAAIGAEFRPRFGLGMGGGAWGPVVASLSKSQIERIQRAICMPAQAVDGVWGTNTQRELDVDRARRVARWAVAGVPNENSPLTAGEARVLGALTPEDIRTKCGR